jgi:hypothetical protein
MGGVALASKGQWLSIDMNIAALAVQQAAWTGKNVAQIVIALDIPAAGGTFYLDNLYWCKPGTGGGCGTGGGGGGGGGGAPPTTVASAPTLPAANVNSLFSAAYTGGKANGDYSANVSSYNATCFGPGGSTVADYTIAGTSHVVKKYTLPASDFGIIEMIGATGGIPSPPDSTICHGGTQVTTGANLIRTTGLTGIHMDVWSPGGSTVFNVHLTNADGTNTVAGPGAAAGASPGSEIASGSVTIGAGTWVPVDIKFADMGPPGGGVSNLALVKFFSQTAGTFYVDNVYLYK